MIVIEEDKAEIAKHAAEAIIDIAKNISNSKGFVTIALPGGRSVKEIYEVFKTIDDPVWNKIHLFLVDERAVKLSDLDSNFKLVWESFASSLVKKKLLPLENIHALKIDENNHGTSKYLDILNKFGGQFDIVLVSSGEDGHIAALYPNHKALTVKGKQFIYLNDSPKPPSERITSSIELIHSAKLLILIFIGESKRQAYENFNNIKIPILDCPAKIANKMKHAIIYSDIKYTNLS
jgi:6-phosphogluconolactonase